MKGKTLWIVIGVITLLVIIFFVWRKNQQKKLDAQAEIDRMNQANIYPGSTTSTTNGGVSTTLDSVGGILDSLSGIFSGIGSGSSGGGNTISPETYNQMANDCELLYNTTSDVEACIASKIAGA